VDNRWRTHKTFAAEPVLYALGQIELANRFDDRPA
jgi:hypothetical protein